MQNPRDKGHSSLVPDDRMVPAIEDDLPRIGRPTSTGVVESIHQIYLSNEQRRRDPKLANFTKP